MCKIEGVIKNSRIPLYQQVKAHLFDFIRNKDKEFGAIPAETEPCGKFGLSRGTVRAAVLELVGEGIPERVSGKGTFTKKHSETLRFASRLSGETSAASALAQLKEFFYGRTVCVVEDITIPYLEMERSLIAMASRGETPDLVSLICLWTPLLAYYDALFPLEQLYAYEVTSSLYPQTMSPMAYKDRIYRFNWINCPNILYANKDPVERYLGAAELSTGMLSVNINELKTNHAYDDEFVLVVQKQMETAIPIKTGKPNAFWMAVMICANASREILLGHSSIPSTLNDYAEIMKEIYRH